MRPIASQIKMQNPSTYRKYQLPSGEGDKDVAALRTDLGRSSISTVCGLHLEMSLEKLKKKKDL